ncbi:MAG: TIGR00730 family Rossman fold protein [Synechococcaceae cyanobacterium RL_1_2]|nr:TIGR00730 family Rossman fold protein [Synechococcaceae cyanobacterium RL_1_2]
MISSSTLKTLCVFCGSRRGADPAYQSQAESLGTLLAQKAITLVYGGGNVGLMGVVANAVMAAGGEAIGIIPEFLSTKEIANFNLTELIVVSSMHERKAKMAALAHGFIALPGGTGTFEEFLEVLTWAQLNLHHKPIGLFNCNGYYDGLLGMFDTAIAQGFIEPKHRSLILDDKDLNSLMEKMENHHQNHQQLAKEFL